MFIKNNPKETSSSEDALLNDVGLDSDNEGEVVSGVKEVSTSPMRGSSVEWIFDPTDVLKKFELFLRGYYYDSLSNPPAYKKIYKYKRNEKGELVKYHYKLANDLGINDIMSKLTLYINKVFSFSRSEKPVVEKELKEMCYDLYDRYIVDKGEEFNIKPADAYIIVNDMYNIIHSAWSQGFNATALRSFTESTTRQEIINPSKRNSGGSRWNPFNK